MPNLIDLILSKKADKNKVDKDKETPLILAVRARIVENVEKLIDEKNVNKPNSHKNTPVHIACQNGFSEILDILISHNADITKKNEDGNTPIHIATMYKQRECVEILIDAGADILELNGKYKSAFAMSTGEITTLMKREIEKNHKQNRNIELRHADQVTLAMSKNTRTSSKSVFGRSSKPQNSQTQSKVSSKAASKSTISKQQTNRQQENTNSQVFTQDGDKKSTSSKTVKFGTSMVRNKQQKQTEIEYMEDYMNTINSILDNARERFDAQIDDVKQELDDLIADLGKYDIVQKDDDTNEN